MSCIIYEFSAGKIVSASSMTNLVTKNIKIEILCHVKPKEQSFTTCDLFWTDAQTREERKIKLQTLQGEALILVHLTEHDVCYLQAWSYFTHKNCLVLSGLKFNGSEDKYTVALLKVNKESKIKVRNFFSSSQRHGNYIQKNYIITFDGENFTVEVKQKELPPEHFGQK